MGQRSDFSKPCQEAAEKSANATRRCCLVRGSHPVGMSTKAPLSRCCFATADFFIGWSAQWDENSTALPKAGQAISPVGCCLVRGSHPVGMSTKAPLSRCFQQQHYKCNSICIKIQTRNLWGHSGSQRFRVFCVIGSVCPHSGFLWSCARAYASCSAQS